MRPSAAAAVLTEDFTAALAHRTDLAPLPALDRLDTDRARRVLAGTELLVTGWGCPPLDETVLAAAPALRAVVHTAGSVKDFVTDALFRRGIAVTSAAAANAVPVAEYALAVILLHGKRFRQAVRTYRATRSREAWSADPALGNNGRTVGLVSASLVGRRLLELLRHHDFRLLLHDPYLSPEEAAALGARLVPLETLFAESDVVSLHTPLLPATRGLVDAALLARMRPGALLLNTARGAVVDGPALTEALLAGRIQAVLDVTDPEPLPPEHPLWECDDVLLTPHIAGSLGNELSRLTDLALQEVDNWRAGRGFAHPVEQERLAFLA
ncbi:hydroxyacid dehydrogenase [Streptomyces sp. NPDC059740]|uniref:hydroxyacid dehydrogenase n=1 Tax=Streptomyces sp. NPDC059740 TaxID=3346926 RepID=UPI00365CB171